MNRSGSQEVGKPAMEAKRNFAVIKGWQMNPGNGRRMNLRTWSYEFFRIAV